MMNIGYLDMMNIGYQEYDIENLKMLNIKTRD